MQIRLSAVIQLLDGYRRRPIRAAEVSFLINHALAKPVYKQDGYFAFPNIPPGHARIDVLSSTFMPEIIEVDIPDAAGQYCSVYKVLNPSRAYPYNGPPTVLCGNLTSGGTPAAYEKMLLYMTDSRESLKISQDNLKAGSADIKLFSSQQTRRLPLPGSFFIYDKDAKKRESCFITGTHENENTYMLGSALLYDHARATPLLELLELSTAADGSFYIAVPERYYASQHAEFVILSTGKTLQASLSRGRQTDMGRVEIV